MALETEEKQLLDDMRTAWEEFKHVHTEAQGELETLGEFKAETKTTFDKLQDELDQLEVRLQKTALDTPKRDGEPTPERKAFESLLRSGRVTGEDAGLLRRTDGAGNEIESKAMEVSDDTEGGIFAPEEVVDEVIKGIVEFSPIRTIARVRSTVRHAVRFPKRTGTAAAVWVGEVDTRTETTNPKWGKEEVATRELSAMADLSRQDLEDTAVDLEELVYGEFSEQFGVAEGAAFVSGDGVDGKPEGFLFASDQGYLGANGIETLPSGTNDTFTGDDLIKLFFLLKEGYVPNATWVMRRSTIRDVRLLKETTTDNYLWQPGLAGVAPATILDRPYVEAIDMPAKADGALCVAFGDFRRGYLIVDRILIETLRDPYTQAGQGYVRIWARKRVGGAVVLTEAIKILRIQ